MLTPTPTPNTAAAGAAREKPILFSGPMVRAILEGRKSQTRRVIKGEVRGDVVTATVHLRNPLPTPPYMVDDVLWVREAHLVADATCWADTDLPYDVAICYCADGEEAGGNYVNVPESVQQKWMLEGVPDFLQEENWNKWRPSIHMHRWTSRISLRVTKVRCERLQDISDADCYAEGAISMEDATWPGHPQECFRDLWDSINGKTYPWDSNPWVWVYEFEVVAAALAAVLEGEG